MRRKNTFKSSAFRKRRSVDSGAECKPPTYRFSWATKRWNQKAKMYTKIPCWENGKKRRNPKIMEMLSAYLIILDYANQEVRIINTGSYCFLIFHLSILKNTRQPRLHFIHVIDSVDLSKASSGEILFLNWRLCSSEPYSQREEEKDWW